MGTGVQLLSKEKRRGVPLIANGFTDKARKQAITNVESIREAVGVKGIPVIATSSTCTFALRGRIPGSAECRQQRLARSYRTGDPLAVAQAGRRQNVTAETAAAESGLSHSVPYGKNGLDADTLELLRNIPGLELTVLDSQCCGIAGTYGFKE